MKAKASTHTITTRISYTIPSGHDIVYASAPEKSLVTFAHIPTEIIDARPFVDQLSLDTNGFQLVDRPARVADPRQRDYLPQVERLVAELTGAAKVVAIQLTVRDEREPGRADYPPARSAHVDGTIDTYRSLLHTRMESAEATYWLQHRFAAINVWRPIFRVERTPLAVADARTIDPDDLVTVLLQASPDDPRFTLEGLHLKHNPAQRFYYFPDMRPEEALVFKLWDTGDDPIRCVAHTAIDDPTSAPEAPGRVSVDVRTLAFYAAP